jgi:hypothetical protein
MAATIDALRDELVAGKSAVSEAYRLKQLHPVPVCPVVKRTEFILELAKGQTVLHVGASGKLHEALLTVAAKVYGLDRNPGEGIEAIDLDDYHAQLPAHPDVTLIVCGEVLEHLSNPGWLLDRLRAMREIPMIVTVPNAFSAGGLASLNTGIECVHREHVAYYSYRTLLTLLERHGWALTEAAWYHGHPKFAEGLIMVVT